MIFLLILKFCFMTNILREFGHGSNTSGGHGGGNAGSGGQSGGNGGSSGGGTGTRGR